MKAFLLIPLGVAALYDGFTTFVGIAVMLRAQHPMDYALSAIGAIVVLGLSLSTKMVFAGKEAVYTILRMAVIISVLFDFWTAFIANIAYILGKKETDEIMNLSISAIADIVKQTESERVWVIIFLTVLISGAPIMFSLLMGEEEVEREATSG